MTKNNNKSVLVALLLAPLLTAGFTVGNIQQAEAVPEIPLPSGSIECENISPDTIQWSFGITDSGTESYQFEFQLMIENSTGTFLNDGGIVDVDPGVTASATIETSGGPSVYTGTLIVTNEIGDADESEATCVTVGGLIADVEALDLNTGNINSLNKKLENAIKNITNEDPTDDAEACEKLQSFIDQLNAFVNSG